ncbi:hypothetical protein [Streptomyces sp. NPDC054958]
MTIKKYPPQPLSRDIQTIASLAQVGAEVHQVQRGAGKAVERVSFGVSPSRSN